MSGGWWTVINEAELQQKGMHRAVIQGWHIVVGHTEGDLFAINDRCTHQASLLSTGRVRRGAIMCPLHGARFDVMTGKCIGGTYHDVRLYPVRVTDGQVEVEIPDGTPGMEDLPVIV